MSGDHPPLPGVLAEIAEIAGRDAALDLALALGGTSIYVPHADRLHPRHRLCAALSADAARRVAERFHGEILDIPLARRPLARRLMHRGLSNAVISQQLNLSLKTVRRYRR